MNVEQIQIIQIIAIKVTTRAFLVEFDLHEKMNTVFSFIKPKPKMNTVYYPQFLHIGRMNYATNGPREMHSHNQFCGRT